jgi:hypothetical protein
MPLLLLERVDEHEQVIDADAQNEVHTEHVENAELELALDGGVEVKDDWEREADLQQPRDGEEHGLDVVERQEKDDDERQRRQADVSPERVEHEHERHALAAVHDAHGMLALGGLGVPFIQDSRHVTHERLEFGLGLCYGDLFVAHAAGRRPLAVCVVNSRERSTASVSVGGMGTVGAGWGGIVRARMGNMVERQGTKRGCRDWIYI